jgi:hypothetical protein
MWAHRLCLGGAIRARMAVHAAWMLDHTARFFEQRNGPCGCVSNPIEVCHLTQTIKFCGLQSGLDCLCLRHGTRIKSVDEACRRCDHDHSEYQGNREL